MEKYIRVGNGIPYLYSVPVSSAPPLSNISYHKVNNKVASPSTDILLNTNLYPVYGNYITVMSNDETLVIKPNNYIITASILSYGYSGGIYAYIGEDTYYAPFAYNHTRSAYLTFFVNNNKLYFSSDAIFKYLYYTENGRYLLSRQELNIGDEIEIHFVDDDPVIDNVISYAGQYISGYEIDIPLYDNTETSISVQPNIFNIDYENPQPISRNSLEILLESFGEVYDVTNSFFFSSYTPYDYSLMIGSFGQLSENIITPSNFDIFSSNRYEISYSTNGVEYKDLVTVNITNFPNNNSPYDNGQTSTSGGGGGSYGGGTFGGGGTGGQSSSDDIASTVPVGSANNSIGASSMLYTRYLLTQSDLDFIGEWLWTPNLGLNIAKTFVSLAYGSPVDAIISVYAYPFSIGGYLEGYSAQQQIFCYGGARAAIAGTAHMAYALLNNAVSFNWGSLKIDEYWGNFLDYAPHTTVELYLPWGVGFVSLDPNQVMGRTLTIRTNIDITKGTCVHNIFDDLGSVIGTYSGQCAKQLPMTSLDNASKLAGITAAAVGTIASAAVGVGEGFRNATGGDPISFTNYGGAEKSGTMIRPKEFNKVAAKNAFKQGTKAALASATALSVGPSHVQRNGSFSDSSSFLGVQYPYIIVSRPTQSVPEEYGHHYGYPSNIYQGLRYLSGYTEMGEIHLTGIPCTDSELKELDSALKGGVLF